MPNDSPSQSQSSSLWRQTIVPSLSLFTSIGTLLCCALPAMLVTLGFGAVLAGLVGTAPWITVVSQYKVAVFAAAAIMLAAAGFMQYKARHAPCPADPLQAQACTRMRRISLIIFIFSIVIYVIGFFFAFLAADLFY